MEGKREKTAIGPDGVFAEVCPPRRTVAKRAAGQPVLGRARRRLSPAQLALADVEREVGLVDLAWLFADVEAEAADQGRW